MVRGAGLPDAAHRQLPGGGCAAVCAGHVRGGGGRVVPGAVDGHGAVAGRRAVPAVRGAAVASSSDLLALLYRVRGLHGRAVGPARDGSYVAARGRGIRIDGRGADSGGAARAGGAGPGPGARDHGSCTHVWRIESRLQMGPGGRLGGRSHAPEPDLEMAAAGVVTGTVRRGMVRGDAGDGLVAGAAARPVCVFKADRQQRIRGPLSFGVAAGSGAGRHASGGLFYSAGVVESLLGGFRRGGAAADREPVQPYAAAS